MRGDDAGAYRQLQQLYRISKRLTRFESVEPAVTEVLALATEAVPMRSAVLALQENGDSRHPRMTVWPVEGVEKPRLHAARAKAMVAFAYLVGDPEPDLPDRNLEDDLSALALPLKTALPPRAGPSRYILLPLVVDRARIFGLLLVEGDCGADEETLAFLSAVANQLAVALDRLRAIRAEQDRAEAAGVAAERAAARAARREHGQRLLSETSSLLGASLNFHKSIRHVLRAAVPFLADVCYLDELTAEGGIRCAEVAFADPAMLPLERRFRQRPPPPNPEIPLAQVLTTGESVVLQEIPDLRRIAHDDSHADLLKRLGIGALLTVPLHARGRTLGALTFLSAGSRRGFSSEDLLLAEELGRRTALACDNSRLYAHARRAIRTREHLLAVVSHDLKNPLAGILMAVGLLLSEPDVGERERRLLEAMRGGGRQMERLIADLLDIAALEGGRLAVDPKRQSVREVLEEASESVSVLAEQKGVALEIHVSDEAMQVDVDRVRMLQVFGNLLGNALKFTPAGGTIRLSAEVQGPEVRFAVADTGPGIEPAVLGRVFEPYWQAERTAHLGTGLGLSVAKGLVEAHGGHIWVESPPGQGATFHFTVPAPPA